MTIIMAGRLFLIVVAERGERLISAIPHGYWKITTLVEATQRRPDSTFFKRPRDKWRGLP
jgi:hypothetical protein